MNCKCFYTAQENLQLKTGDKEAELSSVLSFKYGSYIPALVLTSRTLKTDGTLTKKESRSYVVCSYCPFCGQEFKEPSK